MMSNSLNGAVAQPPVRRSKHAPTPMFGPEEIAQIKADLALPDSTQAAVARKWGVTSSVISRIDAGHYPGQLPRGGTGRHRGKPRVSPEKVKRIFAELQVPGSTFKSVAEKVGVSLGTIYRLRAGLHVSQSSAQQLGKLGGDARAKKLTPEQRTESARKAAAKRWSPPVEPVAAPSHAAFLDELIRFLRTITALVELERRRYE